MVGFFPQKSAEIFSLIPSESTLNKMPAKPHIVKVLIRYKLLIRYNFNVLEIHTKIYVSYVKIQFVLGNLVVSKVVLK